MSGCLNLPVKGGTNIGEVSMVGSGRLAYLRVEIKDGAGKGKCAWVDNSAQLRRFLRSALRRCEARKNEKSDAK